MERAETSMYTQSESQQERAGLLGYALLFVSILGILDTLYLTVSYLNNSSVVCSVLNGCDTVLQSSYASMFGVPLSLVGLLYYCVLTILILVSLFKGSLRSLFYALILSSAALGVSLTLIIIQSSVLGAYCLYCVLSSIITLLIVGLLFYTLYRDSEK